MTRTFALLALVVACAAGLGVVPHAAAGELMTVQNQRSGFPVVLDVGRINFGSVTLADLNGDGRSEILVGSETGILYALNADGKLRWKYDVSAAINRAAMAQPRLVPAEVPSPIRSAPAVADVTGDGRPEIFVSAGDVLSLRAHGGVMGLTADGAPLPGWPQVSCNIDLATGTPPTSFTPMETCAQLNGAGFADGVVTSPAIGDITGDGVPEIVYAGFDQFVYARRPDGSILPGWPYHSLDTVWSSPALADLDSDGVDEVIIGLDGQRYRGPSYNGDFRDTQRGGYLAALRGNGKPLWLAYQDEVFQSSPAVADLDGDGLLEVAAGTGLYYCCNATDKNGALGRYFSVWNHDGSLLWRTALPGQVEGAPAIGDVTGDAGLEVIFGATDGKLYALDGKTGAIRWSTTVRDTFNNSLPITGSPVLGDYTGDGRDDVFLAFGWDVIVLRGTDGAQLTGTHPEKPEPSYFGSYIVNGVPALGDLDGDGKIELVSGSGTRPEREGRAQINSWDLPNATGKASWPMLRGRPDHRAVVLPKLLKPTSGSLGGLLKPGQTRNFDLKIGSTNGDPVSWSVQQSGAQNVRVTFNRTSGRQGDTLRVTITPTASGNFSATLTIRADGFPTMEIPIRGRVVNNIFQVYAPALRR